MGIYINPGKEGFSASRRTEYVDKSGLIALVNRSIDTGLIRRSGNCEG